MLLFYGFIRDDLARTDLTISKKNINGSICYYNTLLSPLLHFCALLSEPYATAGSHRSNVVQHCKETLMTVFCIDDVMLKYCDSQPELMATLYRSYLITMQGRLVNIYATFTQNMAELVKYVDEDQERKEKGNNSNSLFQ